MSSSKGDRPVAEHEGPETVEILRRARALIEDPEHWTTGKFARDQADRAVGVKHRAACKWCAVGALSREASGPFLAEAVMSLLGAAERSSIAAVNDRDGHAAVLAMYDRAIALAPPCPTCGGSGEIHYNPNPPDPQCVVDAPCPDCGGRG